MNELTYDEQRLILGHIEADAELNSQLVKIRKVPHKKTDEGDFVRSIIFLFVAHGLTNSFELAIQLVPRFAADRHKRETLLLAKEVYQYCVANNGVPKPATPLEEAQFALMQERFDNPPFRTLTMEVVYTYETEMLPKPMVDPFKKLVEEKAFSLLRKDPNADLHIIEEEFRITFTKIECSGRTTRGSTPTPPRLRDVIL